MKKTWLDALRTQQHRPLPPGFDDRFWKKFEARYGDEKSARYPWWKKFNFSYAPTALVFGLTAWVLLSPIHSSAHHPWLPMNDMATMSEEEWDLVKNLDALDSFENDDDFPKTSNEWQNLLDEGNGDNEI